MFDNHLVCETMRKNPRTTCSDSFLRKYNRNVCRARKYKKLILVISVLHLKFDYFLHSDILPHFSNLYNKWNRKSIIRLWIGPLAVFAIGGAESAEVSRLEYFKFATFILSFLLQRLCLVVTRLSKKAENTIFFNLG